MRASLPMAPLSCELARTLVLVYVLILLFFLVYPNLCFLLQLVKRFASAASSYFLFSCFCFSFSSFLCGSFLCAFSLFLVIGFFRSNTALRTLSSRFKVLIMIFEGCNATNTVVPSTFSRVKPSR